MQQRLFIVGAKRTPFGAFGGKLKGLTATDLAVKATAAALSAAKVFKMKKWSARKNGEDHW